MSKLGLFSNAKIVDQSGYVTGYWQSWFRALWRCGGGSGGGFGALFLTTSMAALNSGTIYIGTTRPGFIVNIQATTGTGTVLTSAEVLTIKNSSGSTMGTLTIPLNSTAGTVATSTPYTNNYVVQNDYISITSSGLSTGTVPVMFTVTFEYDSA